MILTGFTAILDGAGVTNSKVCLKRLQQEGFPGGLSTVKEHISTHQHLVPAKRHLAVPQYSRGRRHSTEPGEAFQMDWGFTKCETGNLFIGMLCGFRRMGVPQYILTDNMKSVVVRRDSGATPSGSVTMRRS